MSTMVDDDYPSEEQVAEIKEFLADSGTNKPLPTKLRPKNSLTVFVRSLDTLVTVHPDGSITD